LDTTTQLNIVALKDEKDTAVNIKFNF